MRAFSGFALPLAATALAMALPAAAPAQQVEVPPAFNAAQIPGIERVGSNYTVRTPVQSDGLLRAYVLDTPYGEMDVRGDAMLKMRINELRALALLEKVSNSETFARALAQAGLNPLKYTGSLITNPLGTVKTTLAGVGALFGRIGSGISNAGKTPDNALAGLLGVTGERRQLAAAYGVDPYTDFPPLDAKLKQLSEAAALGGLAVTGALIAVPGAAGIVVSNLATANKLNDAGLDEVARQYTAAQILDLNRDLLTKMDVPPPVTARLLANGHYTPIDMAALVAALDSMAQVQDRKIFVERAAAADARFVAFTLRRQAELLADANRRGAGYVRFVDVAGHPFLVGRDGRIKTLAPIDALSWTNETAVGFDLLTAARRQIAPKAAGEIRITGEATALARQKLKALGWTVIARQGL